MRRPLLALLVAAAWAAPADAYLHFTLTRGTQTVAVKWQQLPLRWFATDRGAPGVPASEFQAAAARAFATWEQVPTASVTARFAGFTGAQPFDDDGISVLGFETQFDDRVLAETGFLVDTITGEIVEADVSFNAAIPWSTAAGGDPARFDLESVALHEIGHVLGLGHSALGETEVRGDGRRVIASGAVMFPISFGRGSTADRELQQDDIAGVSDLYPAGGFEGETGIARGRVTRNGVGVVGAHVVAFNPETGALVGAFTLTNAGDFEIAGLAPGPHVLRVEPLDDADLDSFFDPRDVVDVGFQVTFHDRFFIVPRGGAGERVTVAVRPK